MKKLAFFSLLLLGLLSCKKAERIPNTDNRIFPLAIGNSWTYTDTLVYFQDSIPKETTVTSFTWEVTREGYLDEPFGDRRRMEAWKVAYTKDSCGFAAFVRSDETGIVFMGFEGESGAIQLFEGDYVIKYPMSVGEIFVPEGMMWFDCYNTANSEIGPSSPDTLTLNSTTTQLTCPAGTFTVHDFGNQFWAPDVGLIRISYRQDVENTTTFHLDSHLRTRTLTSYSLVQ
ncbi:MAG: hypothetical protein H6581_10980 [Bacteroidia bacterium]|nr:hypothetical protein [Bacteroidia bacterium]